MDNEVLRRPQLKNMDSGPFTDSWLQRRRRGLQRLEEVQKVALQVKKADCACGHFTVWKLIGS
jgi:hypothetical protein